MATKPLTPIWSNQTRLPDGSRIFRLNSTRILDTDLGFVPKREGNRWAMADESGEYPEDTDNGVLWLDFNRVLNAGGSGDAVPTVPLLDMERQERSTITNTATLLELSAHFRWDINVLGRPMRAILL